MFVFLCFVVRQYKKKGISKPFVQKNNDAKILESQLPPYAESEMYDERKVQTTVRKLTVSSIATSIGDNVNITNTIGLQITGQENQQTDNYFEESEVEPIF